MNVESPADRVARLCREIEERRQQPVDFGELVRRLPQEVPDLSGLPPKVEDEAKRPPLSKEL